MWVKRFFWAEWRNKVRPYYPCPGFCDDPDQRQYRFRRWCDLGFKINWRRGGSTRLYRLYWRTHPVEYQRMLQNMQPKRANK